MQTKALEVCLKLLKNRWGSLFQDQVTNILAYGSAAVPQTKDRQVLASNTLDLMIEVRDSNIFHRELLSSNKEDYAGLAWLLGPAMMQFSQRNIFPMHSNHIVLGDRKVKYSIVGMTVLREDLRGWKYLSFAGRLHKAVIPLQSTSEGFDQDIKFNREAALSVALLLSKLNQQLSTRDIMQQIVQLSYTGDIRFSAGAQNPKKVQNIVTHSWNQLSSIYNPLLSELSQKIPGIKFNGDTLNYQLSPPFLAELLRRLPSHIQEHLVTIYGGPNLVQNILLAGIGDLKDDITKYIRKTNSSSSMRMAYQNLLTASPINNLKYLLSKFEKGRKTD